MRFSDTITEKDESQVNNTNDSVKQKTKTYSQINTIDKKQETEKLKQLLANGANPFGKKMG